MIFIQDGQIECLDWLLDNMSGDEDTSPPKRSLLHWAAKFGQVRFYSFPGGEIVGGKGGLKRGVWG